MHYSFIYFILFFQLHAVSRTQQGRQREPSVKTLRSQRSARVLEALRVEWWNLMPRFASTPERKNGNINVNKYFSYLSGNRIYNLSQHAGAFAPRLVSIQSLYQKTIFINQKY